MVIPTSIRWRPAKPGSWTALGACSRAIRYSCSAYPLVPSRSGMTASMSLARSRWRSQPASIPLSPIKAKQRMPAMRASKLVMSCAGPAKVRSGYGLPAHRRSPRSSSSGRRAICDRLISSPFCAGAMLMDPHQRRIDEDVFEIRIPGQVLENPLPHVLLRPPPEARVDGVPFAKFVRQIAPRRTCPSHPQHPFHKQTIVVSAASRITDLPWQFRCNPFPLGIT